MLSSCAWAPLRNPPPGCFADANTRHATPAPSRRAAARLVSFVTSVTRAPGLRGTGAGIFSSGRCSRVPAAADLTASPIRTSRPPGDRYPPASMIAMVSAAMARRLSRTLSSWPPCPGGGTLISPPAAQIHAPDGVLAVTAAGEHNFDTRVPHNARVYNYLLGGKANFAADREAGERFV